MSAIVPAQSQSLVTNIGDMQKIAATLSASGYFKDTKDASQAFVKVLAGHELGIPPFASMTGIHIIQGKPEIGANILAALVKSSGRYNYRVTRMDESACVIVFFERWDGKWEPCGESVFTIEDAKRAGTQNIQKFPRNMLFARAISNGVKWFCPDITAGQTTYTDGETSGDETPPPFPMTSPAPQRPISEFKKAAIAFREAASVATNLEDLDEAFNACDNCVETPAHREWLDNEMGEAIARITAQAKNDISPPDQAVEIADPSPEELEDF
jgi:hypothetical protein